MSMLGFSHLALGFSFPGESSVSQQFVTRATDVVPQDASALTTLFTITGTVLLRLVAVCVEAPTASAGITLACKGYTASSAGSAVLTALGDAKLLLINTIWTDDTLANHKAVASTDPIIGGFLFGNGTTIKLVPTGTFTAGKISFFCIWTPLSTDGCVAVA